MVTGSGSLVKFMNDGKLMVGTIVTIENGIATIEDRFENGYEVPVDQLMKVDYEILVGC